MAWRCSGKSNKELVHNLKSSGLIKSNIVESAMLKVDRRDFVSHDNEAYEDHPSPIGHGATISAPHMHANALELLSSRIPGHNVLDVGCGSGYLTAAMAHMGAKTVVGIDYIPSLTSLSRTNLNKSNADLPIHIITGDGWKGHKEYAPYKAIHVGAAADSIPRALVDQLDYGGRMVVPVGSPGGSQVFYQVDKDENGHVHEHALFNVMYVPLVHVDK